MHPRSVARASGTEALRMDHTSSATVTTMPSIASVTMT